MIHLKGVDEQIAEVIRMETQRQEWKLEMIASENYVSDAVMEAMGSVLTNKYAEGLPGRRYYGGCEFVDVAEDLARERALELFGADAVNVQPHSGAQANMAVFFAALKPGETVLGMSLTTEGISLTDIPLIFQAASTMSLPTGFQKKQERSITMRLGILPSSTPPDL